MLLSTHEEYTGLCRKNQDQSRYWARGVGFGCTGHSGRRRLFRPGKIVGTPGKKDAGFNTKNSAVFKLAQPGRHVRRLKVDKLVLLSVVR